MSEKTQPKIMRTQLSKPQDALGYCFISLKDRTESLSVFKKLAEKNHVLSCEAVRGKADLILLFSAKSAKELEDYFNFEWKGDPLFARSLLYPISESQCMEDRMPDQDNFLACATVQALVHIETDGSRETEIFRKLSQIPEVFSCVRLDANKGIIFKMRASSFNKLEEIVSKTIKVIPGISRLNLYKVIDLAPKLNYPALNQAIWNFRGEIGQIIPLLQSAQESFGYIPAIAVKYISGVTGHPESELYGVITFYKQFRLRPVGKYLVRLCDGTACHVNNAKMLREVIVDELKLANEDTTADGLFTLVPVACLGCCSLAPAMMVNDMTHGRLTPQSVRSILRTYRKEGQATLKSAEVAQ